MKKVVIGAFSSAIIIILIVLSSIYIKVKKWDGLVYRGVTIDRVDVSSKTKKEVQDIVKKKFDKIVQNRTINMVTDDNKTIPLKYSDINVKYDIDKAVSGAFDYGKSLSIYDRYKLLHNPKKLEISVGMTYDKNALENSIKNLSNTLNKKAKDATIVKTASGFQITPEADGKKVNEDKLKADIEGKITDNNITDYNVKINMDAVKANATQDKLKGINTLISSFNTEYASLSSPQRANNITLATKAINGIVLMPGDSFSFNGVVGERTAAKGYQSAPVLIGNKSDMGLGGGICQVSTTLYNTVLTSGIKATERHHHTLPSHYVPVGYDATVDYGTLDYKFKNTLSFPIYIEGNTDNGHVTFNIYSDASLLSKTYKVSSENISDSVPKAKVYLETYENGTLISKDMIANDAYSK
ncbi:vancomycin resistance protein YoaR [Clostridium acetobutylicum]|uniref:Uncharacterized conserved protein, VanW of Enterococcus faecalis related n=1 Tax=Clostridium acetobutylicum (strain ATCC 824 / DSM 792 / JCM 1419 / IAM 19013 / LMG 5710 / NBRC 13948 / NRRL B-527 / VKM B-1787 / 2291 / W) TaxID=272562 RepID=Q97L71_CLOAB|nr:MULTISPECIES: VanW family protein [Clostridium]AAK78668.1 Uncharacterized conserved protein, VanW of Enterococcus faecalis related [Clostridium acetobutylicum ATCC 824]ADZ19741.1 Conserved hypothetical protein [Clostridium acetobutylicum EA 2018]AEI33955.1 hypothetical protein SMB_G0705 [Clostridium acetobutylicum DSM 1731]AWV80387.1 hypothetical protein DK921_09830 [Clostridium acetobutylicum]MBC2392576.1 VanW family protein [Clostridium acetobutylicum]